MNYYQHHIGDFVRDTARLSDSQCMAYLRLIWMYYETEQPLENDIDAIAFRIGANASDLHQILKHFFFLHEDGFWHHSRCDKEILAFRERSEKAKKSADARWSNANAMRPHSKRNANAKVSDANQEPVTNIKTYKPPVDDRGDDLLGPENQFSDDNPVDQQADSATGHTNGGAGGLPPADHHADPQCGSTQVPDCPVQRIVDLYHDILPELPRIKVMTERRRSQIRSRWREHRSMQSLERWSAFFEYVRDSDFLMGRTDPAPGRPPFLADLEFITRQSGFVKIIEGKYHHARS